MLMTRQVALALLSFVCFLPSLVAVDLLRYSQWRNNHGGTCRLETDAEGETFLRIHFPKTAKPVHYHAVNCVFDAPVDVEEFKNLEVTVKSSRPVHVSMRINTQGRGSLFTDWSRKQAGAMPQVFDFARSAIPKNKQNTQFPLNLKQATSVTIGFGLWPYDTSKSPLDIEIRGARIIDNLERFLIPRPTAGTVIDAQYKKDWGFENVLYLWTPPEFIRLQGQKFSTGKHVPAPETLSGEFSFMYDAENLYFLAIVADSTPGSGSTPDAPWLNDSIELFLASNLRQKLLKTPSPLRQHGCQIIFDISADGKPLLMQKGQRIADNGIRYKVLKDNVMVHGAPVPGYILEAAIPLKLLPGKFERGSFLAYCLNLNDSSTGASLRSNPQAQKPSVNVFGYNKAFIEYEAPEQKTEYKFAEVAPNVFWPKAYQAERRGIWDDAFVTKRREATRETLLLNGLWAVQGTQDEYASPQPNKWFYAPLPMSIGWHTPTFKLDPQQQNELQHVSYSTVTNGSKHTFYWYERTVTVPEHWRGRKVRLVLDFLSKEARVSVNGKPAGTSSLLQKAVDVSELLEYGKVNRLDLQLHGKMQQGITAKYAGGIYGDIYLEATEQAPVVSDMWMQKADGLDGSFVLQVQTPDLAVSDARFALDILNSDGSVLHHAELPVTPGQKHYAFTGVCRNFPQWSLEHPRLSTARLRLLQGKQTLLEEKSLRFGFRTFKVEQGRYLLNGRIVRMRTAFPRTSSRIYDPGRIDYLKQLGFNCLYFHATEGGYNTPVYELCDEKGFLVIAPIEQTLSDEETKAMIRLVRNHPSVVGYVSDPYGQLTANGFNLNPFFNDDTYMPSSEGALNMQKFMERRDALFKQADPERGYIAQGTGNWKDTSRMLHYYPTNGLNLLDRMMYHQPWAQRPNQKLPLNLFEAGTVNLYNMDTMHPEHTFPVMQERAQVKRYLFYEAAARYIGNAAFDDWMQWSYLLFEAGLRDFRLNSVDGFCAWTDELYALPFNTDRALGVKDRRQLSWRYFTESVRGTLDHEWMRTNSWYYQLRALAHHPWPQEFQQPQSSTRESIFAPLYKNEMQPLYLTIAGMPDELFTRDHNYFAGETLRKQIAMVNDTEQAVTVTGTVSLNIRQQTVQTYAFTRQVAQGAIDFEPFALQLPDVQQRTDATLELTAAGRKVTFEVTIFPRRPASPPQARIGVVAGPYPSLTQKAGLKTVPVTLQEGIPEGLDLLVIERGALAADIPGAVLEQYLQRGGNVLVLEQDDTSLYSHRVSEQRLEHAFIADARHPVVQGLSDVDLSFWRGRAETVANEKRPHDAFRHNQSVALETPHLTNRNLVAGFALANPSYGSFRPIITGGYDRQSALLLEAHSGRGRLLLCQLDLSTRYGVDPAATLLTDNLFRYACQPPQSPRFQGVRYLGDEAGRDFLRRLGIRIVEDAPICVVGGGKIEPSSLSSAQTIVRLPGAEYVPAGVTRRRQHLQRSGFPHFWKGNFFQFHFLPGILPGTDFPEEAGEAFRGLSASDFYLFENPLTEAFDFELQAGDARSRHGSAADFRRDGQRFILCAMNPGDLNHGEERIKAYRVWSVIFHNLHVENTTAISFTTPRWDLTRTSWQFITDPDGKGEKNGFAQMTFGERTTRPIVTGKIWEEQGVTEKNPFLNSAPYSAYDGFGWYFTRLNLDTVPEGDIYLHVNGIRDISTFTRTTHQSTLFINGQKMPEAVGIYNAYLGGRGARLWKVDAKAALKPGQNIIAIRIYNNEGAGGIHKNPVRFEFHGKNDDMLFPYEFNECKYTNNFFWCW